MAIAAERHAKHPASDAYSVGVRTENRRMVDGPANRAGDDSGSDSESFSLAGQ